MTTPVNPIKNLDGATVQALGREIQELLYDFSRLHGIQISYAGGSFSAAEATVKLKIACPFSTAPTADETAFKLHARQFGLDPSDMGLLFYARGVQYRIAGARPRATKRPILAKQEYTGKMFCFPADMVRRGLLEARTLNGVRPTVSAPTAPAPTVTAPAYDLAELASEFEGLD